MFKVNRSVVCFYQVFEQLQDEREMDIKGLQIQSKAVNLLLRLLHKFPPVAGTFDSMQGYDMLAVALRCSHTPVTYSLLKVGISYHSAFPLKVVGLDF